MFFKHDNASNRSECNLCKKFITGKHSSNLEKHVFAHHKLQYADLIKAKNKLKQTIENLDAETSLINKINNSQSTLNNFVSISKKSIKLNLHKNSLIAACIEMVTINRRPLTLLQDSGFRKILDPVLDAFLPEKNIEDLIVENEPSNFEDEVVKAIEPEETTILVRCAAHTLNLCIEDGLKIPVIQQVLSRARHVVKKLRTPTYAGLFKRNNLKLAIIDVETRWSSTYDMLERLLKLKSFCQEYEETMPDLKCGKIPTAAACWWNIIAKLEIINTSLSNALKNSMKIRGKNLLENPIFLAANYLDPRFQSTLSEDNKIEAKSHLIKTWNTMENLTSQDSEMNKNNISDIETNNFENVDDPLEQFLKSQSGTTTNLTPLPGSDKCSIRVLIEEFDNSCRLHYKTDIKQFWLNAKKPELFKLAQVAMAVPCTQFH
ncbi:uncharacterized protein LOC126898183 [Daktulosphaira vitifoliae]|uniref:uncharacterized protein LOC126898183 n=1 Tax=Daktulosphaira vitifoliae TaxID=58002 RepID=UPI0021A988A5|nr:uncharacterized protein LOC126898183 [Daktulosphaira vitifoliae]